MNLKSNNLIKAALLFITVLSSYYFAGRSLGKWLYFDKPLKNADLILVEGWLDAQDIRFAAEMFRQGNYKFIITTGIRSSTYFMAGSNGDIIFHIHEKPAIKISHELIVKAYGSSVMNVSAKMGVIINDSNLGTFNTQAEPKAYKLSFSTADTDLIIKIRFLNDAVKGNYDRNLFISGIVLDSKFYSVNDTSVIYQTPSKKDSTIHYMGATRALQAKEILKHTGIPSSKIIAISTLKSSISRTYSTAKETMYTIDSLFPGERVSMNIVTGTLHSRRTYYAYRKNIKEGDSVGVIVAPPVKPLVWNDRKRNIKELTGILYNLLHF